MHPPFYPVDHKVGPHDRLSFTMDRALRRGRPAPLDLSLPSLASQPGPPLADPDPAPAEGATGGWFARFWRRPVVAPA